jgi:hypothetical protein
LTTSAAAFEGGFAVAAERSLFSFQALPFVTPAPGIRAEASHVGFAGAAESSPLPRPAFAHPQGAHSEPDSVAHAEHMAAVTAVAAFRPAGVERHREREQNATDDGPWNVQLPDSHRSPAI